MMILLLIQIYDNGNYCQNCQNTATVTAKKKWQFDLRLTNAVNQNSLPTYCQMEMAANTATVTAKKKWQFDLRLTNAVNQNSLPTYCQMEMAANTATVTAKKKWQFDLRLTNAVNQNSLPTYCQLTAKMKNGNNNEHCHLLPLYQVSGIPFIKAIKPYLLPLLPTYCQSENGSENVTYCHTATPL